MIALRSVDIPAAREAEGPVETAAELAAALLRGEKVVRAGRSYVIDARVNPNEARQGHTGGRTAH